MNLHGIVSAAIGAVNPLTPLIISKSNGYTIAATGKQVPAYFSPVTVMGQVQSLTADDLRQVDGLNLEGEMRAVYINGRSDAIIRPDRKGGDIVVWNGENWLNSHVLEYWPDWCKFVITRQR